MLIIENMKEYRNEKGRLHRIDGPAVESPSGTKEWYIEDKLHRVDGPAIEDSDGSKYWLIEGKRHRVDGPAYEGSNGIELWYYEDKLIDVESQDQFERLLRLKAFW